MRAQTLRHREVTVGTWILALALGVAGCAGDGVEPPTPTSSATMTQTATSSPTLSPVPSSTSTASATASPSVTLSPSATATDSVVPTATPTVTPTYTSTSEPTPSATPTTSFVPGSCDDPNIDSVEPLCALDHAAFTCDFLIPEHCLLPFPSSVFLVEDPSTVTGLRIRYPAQAMPVNTRGKHIDPTEYNTLDGFSPGPMILSLFPQGVDLVASHVPPLTNFARSLEDDSPTVLVDATTGQRVLHFAELDTYAASPATSVFVIRPGVRLTETHRYVVAIRGLIDLQGQAIEAGRPFQILRDQLTTPVQTINVRRESFEQIFSILANAGVQRQDLILAWDFTVASTESLTGRALSMRDQGLFINGPGAPHFEVTSVEENLNDNILRRVKGTFTVPLFMTSATPPAVYNLGPDGMPVPNGFATANFLVNIPRSTVAGGVAHPARPSVYGHGLFGTNSEVNAGHLQVFSNQVNIMFGGTDWIGMSEPDRDVVQRFINDLSFFPRIPDRLQQAMLNFILLGRLFVADDGFVSHPAFQLDGLPLIDRQELYYYGISQGGIEGGAYLALSPDTTRGVLGVGAVNYSTLLQRSLDFAPFQYLLEQWYKGELDRALLYPLLQQLWDRGEPNGYLSHLVSDPLPNTPAKKLLMQIGLNDAQVSNLGSEIEARSLGIPAVAPSAKPAVGMTAQKAPFGGSGFVAYDVNGFAMPRVNQPPIADNGVHEAVRRLSAAQMQIDAFLRPDGVVQSFCPGACVFTDVPNVDTVAPTPTPSGQ